MPSCPHTLCCLCISEEKKIECQLAIATYVCYVFLLMEDFFIHSVLLWQKEASDIPSKSELLMFSYFTLCALQMLCINSKHSSC